jgi:hypothetical protein
MGYNIVCVCFYGFEIMRAQGKEKIEQQQLMVSLPALTIAKCCKLLPYQRLAAAFIARPTHPHSVFALTRHICSANMPHTKMK